MEQPPFVWRRALQQVQALLHHLVGWAAGGPPPPSGERLQLADAGRAVIARAEDGNALGGVRNPLVDAPIAALSGDAPGGATLADLAGGAGSLCVLFGSTTPFDREALIARYGDADGYLRAFAEATDAAVEAGFLLRPDAEALLAEAEGNRALFA